MGPFVPSRDHPAPRIYLDFNATTPVADEVADVLAAHWRTFAANASSAHQEGRAARRLLETQRREIGQLLGAHMEGLRPDHVILTSGGTESNHLALCGLAGSPPGQIVLSAIEHPSVLETGNHLRHLGFAVDHVRVQPNGQIDEDQFGQLVAAHTRLVSVMLANHETGVLQPIRRLADHCAALGVPLHTDAAQAVGKIPVDFQALGVSAMTVSAHKFHGPRGIGALIVRAGVSVTPVLRGGAQQQGLRAGTEPIELAAGLHAALQLWEREAERRSVVLAERRDRLETALRERVPTAVVIGKDSLRLPHTLKVAFPGLDRQALLMALDQAGIACSTGSACESGAARPSHVLMAMGCPAEVVAGALRFSVGRSTTGEEVEQAAHRIAQVVHAQYARRSPACVTEP